MKKNSEFKSVISSTTYINSFFNKTIIYKENKGKSGIYRWNNLITRKSYIGSTKNLNKRFNVYYSSSRMRKLLNRGSSIIYNAILKYNTSNFSLDILEYCEPEILIKREQYYIDLLKPEYNILKIAGSCSGRKFSEKTKERLSITLRGKKKNQKNS